MSAFAKSCFFSIMLIVLVSTLFSAADELIEPTRKLEDPQKAIGYLSVYSDPPGLTVFLDKKKIGKTPIFSKEVKSGLHQLRVEDAKRQVRIPSGESIEFSMHKGLLIEREKKKEEPTAPEEMPSSINQKSQEVQTRKTKPEDKGDKQKLHPDYWPLDPSGPIR